MLTRFTAYGDVLSQRSRNPPVGEPRGSQLFERLSDTVGGKATPHLVRAPPPPGYDVTGFDHDLRDEMREIRGEMGGLRGEITALGERIDASRSEVVAMMHQEIRRVRSIQTRTTVLALAAARTATSALAPDLD